MHGCRPSILPALLLLTVLSAPASASDRWEEAGSGAVAILPLPSRGEAIHGGSLACVEQLWSLRLRTEAPAAAAPQPARLTVDGTAFAAMAEQAAGMASMPVSPDLVEALKTGSRLEVRLGEEEDAPGATFSLRGSRKVIEAVAPRCSPVDMTGFDAVAISETDPAVAEATTLLAEETRLFRAATSGTPKLAAVRLDRGEGREMLFATLCGSSWYYGRTGCTLFGYLRETATQDWREVYNSEGMALYLDPKASSGGWPGLVTLELVGGVTPIHWKWNGDAYELRDPPPPVDEADVAAE